jgi:hypothetical protein
MLSRGRVADGEGVAIRAIHGDNEEAVARGRQTERPVKPGNGFELVVGGPAVEGEDVSAEALVCADDREGGLPAVVRQEEVAGGDGAAPCVAYGAAAEEGFWGEANEDLPDDDLLREAAAATNGSCHCGLLHGSRPGFRPAPL